MGKSIQLLKAKDENLLKFFSEFSENSKINRQLNGKKKQFKRG